MIVSDRPVGMAEAAMTALAMTKSAKTNTAISETDLPDRWPWDNDRMISLIQDIPVMNGLGAGLAPLCRPGGVRTV